MAAHVGSRRKPGNWALLAWYAGPAGEHMAGGGDSVALETSSTPQL